MQSSSATVDFLNCFSTEAINLRMGVHLKNEFSWEAIRFAIIRGHSNHIVSIWFPYYFRPPLLFVGIITILVQEITGVHLRLFHCLVLTVQDVHGILESFDVPGPKWVEGSSFFFCGPSGELVLVLVDTKVLDIPFVRLWPVQSFSFRAGFGFTFNLSFQPLDHITQLGRSGK